MIADISDLGEVEQWIAMETISRLRTGQKIYGQWRLDSKSNFYEAVLEVLDRNNYMAAEILKRNRAESDPSSPRHPEHQDRIGIVPPTE